jgi:hypothetical protein
MKLQLLARPLFRLSQPRRRTDFAVSAELCQRPQKTSLPGLVSSTSDLNFSRLTSFSLPALPLSRQPLFFSPLFNLQVPSNPA